MAAMRMVVSVLAKVRQQRAQAGWAATGCICRLNFAVCNDALCAGRHVGCANAATVYGRRPVQLSGGCQRVGCSKRCGPSPRGHLQPRHWRALWLFKRGLPAEDLDMDTSRALGQLLWPCLGPKTQANEPQQTKATGDSQSRESSPPFAVKASLSVMRFGNGSAGGGLFGGGGGLFSGSSGGPLVCCNFSPSSRLAAQVVRTAL